MNTLTNGEIATGAPHSMARQKQAETFTVYYDAGHAWCKVQIKTLKALSLADKITTYSYMDTCENAYLEEDCDLSNFVQAYESANGCTPKFIEIDHGDRSKIRDFIHYKAI